MLSASISRVFLTLFSLFTLISCIIEEYLLNKRIKIARMSYLWLPVLHLLHIWSAEVLFANVEISLHLLLGIRPFFLIHTFHGVLPSPVYTGDLNCFCRHRIAQATSTLYRHICEKRLFHEKPENKRSKKLRKCCLQAVISHVIWTVR